MNRFFTVALAVAVLGLVWNVFAFVVHALFGVYLPGVDPGDF